MAQPAHKQLAKTTRAKQTNTHQRITFFDQLGKISSNLSENKLLIWVFLALFFILAFLYYPTWEGDLDIWWHFALGKYYITHRTMRVNHAIFSWTPADPNWIYNTWLGSTIDYLLYTMLGGFGLWLFQWGIFMGIYLFFLFFIRSIQVKLDINAIVLMFIVVIAEGVELVYPKPELFTPLFFTAILYIFFSIKRDKISPLYFYLYPGMFILWVNLHGGFIVGLGVIAILLITECLNFIFVRRHAFSRRALAYLGSSLVLTCIACLINPYGWAYAWDTISVNYPLIKQFTGERSLYMSTVILHWSLWSYLFHPINLRFWNTGWIMILMLSMFMVVAFIAFRKKRFLDLSLISVNPILFHYGMNTGRACIFFPILFLFSIYYVLEKAEYLSAAKRYTLICIVLFVCYGITVLIYITGINSFNFFGKNLEDYVPIREVEMIKNFRLPPPLFNDYLSGGYMIWAMYPEYKVFIDSRGGPYDTTEVGNDYTEIMRSPTKENIQQFNIKYPFRVALVSLEYMDTILWFLRNAGEDWRLLYFDKNAVILIHKTLLSSLNQDLLQTINLDPLKFSSIKNPETLFKLFRLYVNIGSRYGDIIENIYKQNVSDFYLFKNDQLKSMEMMRNLKIVKENER